jgi:hypothetical protein
MDVAEFKRTMDSGQMLSCKPAPDTTGVLYPGLPEAEAEVEAWSQKAFLAPEVIVWFHTVCKDLSLPCSM